MLKRVLVGLLWAGVLSAAPMEMGMEPTDIVVNNRILLKINGKPVTVFDVVKKMDIMFYRQYPEYADNAVARYQFYKMAWESVFRSVIEDGLMLADAEEKKIEVSDGDVREEMEKLFGPTVVLNIDRLGMTFEEAWELLKSELLVRKMTGMMVRSKAAGEIYPKELKRRVEAYVEAHPPQKRWTYQLLTVRAAEQEVGERVARGALELVERGVALEEVVQAVGEEGVQVALSETYERTERETSLAHKAVLGALQVGQCSQPVAQGGAVRLFALKEVVEEEVPPFQKLVEKFQGEVMQEAVARHQAAYVEKLREYYGVTEEYMSQWIPKDFTPFTLR